MDKVLILYNADGDEILSISDFTYTAKRMGGAPTITCSVYHTEPTDAVFTGDVYTEFSGERYYLRRKPTSTFSNTDVRYKYDIEFVSERIKLDSVFFFDAVTDESSDYKGVTHSPKVVFSGNIHQFVARLNASLRQSGLDYNVEVDENINSESKNLEFDKQYFSSVLQEIYNTYELPYYFKGKVIHVGYSDSDKSIDTHLQYGENNGLLSVTKTNANHMVVNRITGTGSSDNIPYYYPNETPLGKVEVKHIEGNKLLNDDSFFTISSENKLSKLGVDEHIVFTKFTPNKINGALGLLYEYNGGMHQFGLGWNQMYLAYPYYTEVKTNCNYKYYHIIIRAQVEQQRSGVLRCSWTPVPAYPNVYEQIKENGDFAYKFWDNLEAFEKRDDKLVKTDTKVVGDMNCYIDTTFIGNDNENGGRNVEIHLKFAFYKEEKKNVTTDDISHLTFDSIQLVEDMQEAYLWSSSKGVVKDLKSVGIDLTTKGYDELNKNKDAVVGDGCYLKSVENGLIPFQPNLMPPIYRENFFKKEKDPYFYNALNDTYYIDDNDESKGMYAFPNPYTDGHPQEYFQEFDDIKPTIKGIKNKAGLCINQFLEFAYDEGDNDSYNEDGSLMHPYFYAKLPIFNGNGGFNLFDCVSEQGEMQISMTSGNCAACTFNIMVDKESGKNTLQVDANGDLVRDAQGNVVFGTPQNRQNDTRQNSVWIALHKDIDTFPSPMPNKGPINQPIANTGSNDGDEFVILNIQMPQAYIHAAEKRLESELIKFMRENNEEKFNFSVKFSRIYLEKHSEDVLKKLNENSSIIIEYENLEYPLFVSSFTYKMTSSSILPEISVELTDTVAITQNAIQKTVSEVKHSLVHALEDIDFFTQCEPYFLRKESNDVALGRITLTQGFESSSSASFGNFKVSTNGTGIYQDNNGNWHLETDFVRVRKKLSANTVEIEETRHVGGQQILTAASANVDFVVEYDDFYRCFFRNSDAQGNNITNKWLPEDLAYCREFSTQKTGNGFTDRYYWRKVVGTNLTTSDSNQTYTVNGETYIVSNYHFIDLSKNDRDTASGDIPLEGDSIVQLGHSGSDTSRQNAIILAASGEDSPYIRQYTGIKTFQLPAPDTQIKPNDNLFTGKVVMKSGSNFDEVEDWQKMVESIQQANDRMNGWIEDGVISPMEKQSLRDELANITAEKSEIDKQSERYELTETEEYESYTNAYNSYTGELNRILDSEKENVEVGDLSTRQKEYYDAYATINDKISEANHIFINTLETGYNIVRNSGFVGNFESANLSKGQSLKDVFEMFSPSLEYWETNNAEAQESEYSQSGKQVYIAKDGSISQVLEHQMRLNEPYCLSCYVKGGACSISIGGETLQIEKNNDWARVIFKFKASEQDNVLEFIAIDNTYVCDIMFEKGNVVSQWIPSTLDNRSEIAKFEEYEYIKHLLKANTEIDGGTVTTGIVNTGLLKMGNYDEKGNMVEVTAGMSGIYNDEDSVAFFGGGDFGQAINTVGKFKDNPSYVPTDEELKSMAKVVITHGGRAILEDAIVRGAIYAESGYFRGMVSGTMMRTEILTVNTSYKINLEEQPYNFYYCSPGGGTMIIELPHIYSQTDNGKTINLVGVELSFYVPNVDHNATTVVLQASQRRVGTEVLEQIKWTKNDSENATFITYGSITLPKSNNIYKFVAMPPYQGGAYWLALRPVNADASQEL